MNDIDYEAKIMRILANKICKDIDAAYLKIFLNTEDFEKYEERELLKILCDIGDLINV